MKNLFNFWPEEVNVLSKEKKHEMVQAIIKKSQKLKIAFMLLLAFEMIAVSVLAYLAIFVYQVDLGRGSPERIYFVVAAVALCTLWILPLKRVAKSEYERLKPELL